MAASISADAATHYAAFSLPIKLALIGVLGIGAQWLAWRLQRPAIVLMALAGLIFGPLLGAILQLGLPEQVNYFIGLFRLDPINDFGDLYRPLVGLSVAIILFEGGLNLRFRDLGDARHAVLRMVLFGGPIAWILGTAAAYYIVGLPLMIAVMVGGLFVVTGPTVIMPLLRQAHLKTRPASVLKWEGIVNDPVGALFAVIGYEIIVFQLTGVSATAIFGRLAFAAIFGIVLGIVSAYILARAFQRGLIPEYLKAPVVLAWVLAVYVLSNKLADETGLLTVTALGMTMANLRFAAQVEMRRFKETITIILVSGVFVILT
ncbi:MAG: cation:proton antiporter, partial [Pseudomonadota bacterium]